ncbi:hypothetical protein [Nocardia aurantia]|uniref:hypothetical protein n=1 Tax=Nocardia aurantia TaxID=2585199 RepID=UPI001295E62C|nr:hypothetical protein [Nocardia aurantia]
MDRREARGRHPVFSMDFEKHPMICQSCESVAIIRGGTPEHKDNTGARHNETINI